MTLPLGKAAVGLAGVCAFLLAVLIVEITTPISPYVAPAYTLPKRTPPYVSDFYSPPSEASFGELEQRPIFSSSRKVFETDSAIGPAGSAVTPPLQNATLIGVIREGKTQLALIRIQGAPFAASVAVGEEIQGWRVTEVTADRAILQAGTSQTVLTLGGPRAPSSPQGATPPANANTGMQPYPAPSTGGGKAATQP